MDDMNSGHMHGMAAAPPPAMNATGTTPMHHHRMMMMHMSFYWGNKAVVLFTGWPGDRPGHYAGCLVLVFVLAVLVEFLSRSKLIKCESNPFGSGIIMTLMHAVRMGLAYTVMLAVMSFNVGVFLAAVLGHALGFFIFGSRAFSRRPPLSSEKTSDLPPMNC